MKLVVIAGEVGDKINDMKCLCLIVVIVWTALAVSVAEIRISLLDDPLILNETAALLYKNGSSTESIAAFKKAVNFHNLDLFDRTRFPKEVAGFYNFKNVSQLIYACPDPFCLKLKTNDIAHNTLSCLDTVIVLLKDAGAKAPLTGDLFAAKKFATFKNVGSEIQPHYIIDAVTNYSFYHEGHGLLYPANGYKYLTGLNRSAAEVSLAVSLKGERVLPGDFIDSDPAIRKLFSNWNELRSRDGLAFPKNFKIVTVGYIPMAYKYWAVDHVAVCFFNGDKIIYLEKNGTRGPFIRADFNNEGELAEFAASKLLPDSRDAKQINYQSPVYVALDNLLVHIARP